MKEYTVWQIKNFISTHIIMEHCPVVISLDTEIADDLIRSGKHVEIRCLITDGIEHLNSEEQSEEEKENMYMIEDSMSDIIKYMNKVLGLYDGDTNSYVTVTYCLNKNDLYNHIIN